MSLGCPDFLDQKLRTVAVVSQDPTLPATLSRRPMVKLAKSAKREPCDSATLKTKGAKQAGDKTSKIVKQQASFMKKTAAAPLSYLM